MLQLSAEFFLLSSLSRSWVLRGKVRRGAEVQKWGGEEVQVRRGASESRHLEGVQDLLDYLRGPPAGGAREAAVTEEPALEPAGEAQGNPKKNLPP